MQAEKMTLQNEAVTVCIALGSNLGNRQAIIQSAIASLRSTSLVSVIAVSDIIETAPIGLPNQGAYLNAAALLTTQLSARQFLETVLAIEASHGRDRNLQQRWGPRRLDIDLLLYGDQIVAEPGLQIPHPHMTERQFVLQPLAQIAPTLVHPVTGLTVQIHLDRLRRTPQREYQPEQACLDE